MSPPEGNKFTGSSINIVQKCDNEHPVVITPVNIAPKPVVPNGISLKLSHIPRTEPDQDVIFIKFHKTNTPAARKFRDCQSLVSKCQAPVHDVLVERYNDIDYEHFKSAVSLGTALAVRPAIHLCQSVFRVTDEHPFAAASNEQLPELEHDRNSTNFINSITVQNHWNDVIETKYDVHEANSFNMPVDIALDCLEELRKEIPLTDSHPTSEVESCINLLPHQEFFTSTTTLVDHLHESSLDSYQLCTDAIIGRWEDPNDGDWPSVSAITTQRAVVASLDGEIEASSKRDSCLIPLFSTADCISDDTTLPLAYIYLFSDAKYHSALTSFVDEPSSSFNLINCLTETVVNSSISVVLPSLILLFLTK